MARHLAIDGNNLLYAMHAHAPIPNVGREAMLRIIERHARDGDDLVTLIFDGPQPQGQLAKQFHSQRVHVRFSAPQTADDLLVEMIEEAVDPSRLRIVTADGAIAHAARARRSIVISPIEFIAMLFPPIPKPAPPPVPQAEKPSAVDAPDAEELLRLIEDDHLDLRDDRELFG